MLTYLNDSALKQALLDQLSIHEQQDQFVKGTYARMNGQFRGCAIGCALHSLNILQGKTDLRWATDQHARYETELGLPTWLAYLEDHIFERLPDVESRTWPRRFAEAIPVGAVVDHRTLAQILRWGLADPTHGARHTTNEAAIVAIVDQMIALFDRAIAGQSPSDTEWHEAALAAWTAGTAGTRAVWAPRGPGDAARAAWAAWAAWVARDAARAARDAARAARDAARAARDAFYVALSDYLLDLLRGLPVHAPAVV
jgi:hypothetical protein